MNLIAAVDRNWAIGKAGRELVNIPEDKKFFREETTGKVIVMGRKTFESLPGAMALAGRINIVLSENPGFAPKNTIVCRSFEETKEELAKYPTEDIYIIGGGSIYKQFLSLCDTAHITKVDYKYDADTYFPNLDQLEDWEMTEVSEEHTCFDLEYVFSTYERRQ